MISCCADHFEKSAQGVLGSVIRNQSNRLLSWFREVEQADWTTPAQVLERYPNASIVGRDRVVFRIRHNDYRIVARIFYPGRMVYIRFVGTHSEYNRINAEEV